MNSCFRCLTGALCLLFTAICAPGISAQCLDNVVLVHGNIGHPSDWDMTYQRLLDEGYTSSQIFRPSWGSKICPACNNHSGSEEVPVRNAINTAINNSCTGKIDVIGHSMGVTLAAKTIISEGRADKVDAFIGIAGAYRGLWSCGRYPFNVTTSTCGQDGLSVSSPFLDWLYGKEIASRVYSIKSYADQVVCGTGVCTVGGVHSSRIEGEIESFTYTYGHFGLQKYTVNKQYALLD
ncbi:lipase [Microbulbifer sp. 2205BS26-8]|uniref:lipase n=1 Tax=Microbulbifer sp. 2205BS26-8 TaxID=3064386 RepID=UPI002740294F|nr:lipase [Microbulbifer sp. 2205BS26-8]MDP5210756.1 lipase [Microbulbifer sp. 2205BS26-8]